LISPRINSNSKVDSVKEIRMDSKACLPHQQKRLLQTTLADRHGEEAMEIPVELCSTRNLEGTSLSMIIAGDHAMMGTLVVLQSCKDRYQEMAQQNHRPPFKHIAQAARKLDTVVVELPPMLAEAVGILLDA
jgi:hypothetical protein